MAAFADAIRKMRTVRRFSVKFVHVETIADSELPADFNEGLGIKMSSSHDIHLKGARHLGIKITIAPIARSFSYKTCTLCTLNQSYHGKSHDLVRDIQLRTSAPLACIVMHHQSDIDNGTKSLSTRQETKGMIKRTQGPEGNN